MHRDCSYTRFWHAVGEPRGLRTPLVYGFLRLNMTVSWDWDGLHGRLTGFSLRFTDVLLSLVSVLLNYDSALLNYDSVLLNYGPILLIYGPFLDLPHASCTSGPQIHVSVIIRSKTAKTRVVENTALSQMRSHAPGAACCGAWWGYLAPTSRDIRGVRRVYIRATLRHFDNNLSLWSEMAH